MDQGNFRTTDGNLNRTEYGANGTRTLTSSMSNTAWNARFSEGVSSALVEAAGMRREEAQALRRSVSEAQSRVASEGVERVNSWLQSDSKTRTMGSEERDTWGSTYQVMDQVSQNLQRTHGYSESTAKQAVARAAAEAFVEGSVGTPGQGVLGSGVRAGGRATVGVEASASRNTTETDQVQAARTALSSAGFTDRVDRTTANFASNTFSQTSTAQSMSSEKISDTFSSTRSIMDAADQSESQARSYDQRADFTKTNSATIDQNLNNQFTEYAMQRLVGQRDAYGGVIDEERAAYIMSGRGSAGETAMVRELEQSFRQEEVMKIAAPEQVVQGREIGQTVRQMEPEQVRLLEPGGDGSSLRQGGDLGGAGSTRIGNQRVRARHVWMASRAGRAGGTGGRSPDLAQAPGGRATVVTASPTSVVVCQAEAWPTTPANRYWRPVFNSALRDSIREDVREGGGVIDAHRPADTSLWNSRNVEDTQQEQGSARLGRRYGT